MKKLSEKQRIIQEQAKLIKEKEKESSTDAPSAKDEAILEQKDRAYEEMAKRLDDTEALWTQSVNDLSEKEKIFQEQEMLIEKYKRKVAVIYFVIFSCVLLSTHFDEDGNERFTHTYAVFRNYH